MTPPPRLQQRQLARLTAEVYRSLKATTDALTARHLPAFDRHPRDRRPDQDSGRLLRRLTGQLRLRTPVDHQLFTALMVDVARGLHASARLGPRARQALLARLTWTLIHGLLERRLQHHLPNATLHTRINARSMPRTRFEAAGRTFDRAAVLAYASSQRGGPPRVPFADDPAGRGETRRARSALEVALLDLNEAGKDFRRWAGLGAREMPDLSLLFRSRRVVTPNSRSPVTPTLQDLLTRRNTTALTKKPRPGTSRGPLFLPLQDPAAFHRPGQERTQGRAALPAPPLPRPASA